MRHLARKYSVWLVFVDVDQIRKSGALRQIGQPGAIQNRYRSEFTK